jgi:prepilin-type N-terminal cleavage/methylation domain-containing protein
MKNRQRGVTLMELLTVVTVLGILTSVSVPTYRQYVMRAQRTEAKAALMARAGEVGQQPAEALDLVLDPVGAQRVPVGRGVDRDDRLAEPHLRHRRELHHREVGADLHDRVDVVAVELLDRFDAAAGVVSAMPVQAGAAARCRAPR